MRTFAAKFALTPLIPILSLAALSACKPQLQAGAEAPPTTIAVLNANNAAPAPTCFGVIQPGSPCSDCAQSVDAQTGGYDRCTLTGILTVSDAQCEYTFKIEGARAPTFGAGDLAVYCSCKCRAQFPNYKG